MQGSQCGSNKGCGDVSIHSAPVRVLSCVALGGPWIPWICSSAWKPMFRGFTNIKITLLYKGLYFAKS
jgi:hypothetical protein